MATQNFLIELGTEELPPTALRTLAEAFASQFEAQLKDADLSHQGVTWYASPRRRSEGRTSELQSQLGA